MRARLPDVDTFLRANHDRAATGGDFDAAFTDQERELATIGTRVEPGAADGEQAIRAWEASLRFQAIGRQRSLS